MKIVCITNSSINHEGGVGSQIIIREREGIIGQVYKGFFLQNDQIPEDHRSSVVDHVVHVHLSVGNYSKEFLQKLRRVNHITPKNYLDFVSTYTSLLQEKDKFVLEQCQRLSGGLTKLMEATEQIKVLNEQLQVQKVAVSKKSEACEVLLQDISEKTAIGQEKKEMAQIKSVEMEEQNKVRGLAIRTLRYSCACVWTCT